MPDLHYDQRMHRGALRLEAAGTEALSRQIRDEINPIHTRTSRTHKLRVSQEYENYKRVREFTRLIAQMLDRPS